MIFQLSTSLSELNVLNLCPQLQANPPAKSRRTLNPLSVSIFETAGLKNTVSSTYIKKILTLILQNKSW